MQNAQISERIKFLCNLKSIMIKDLLIQCGINRNFIYDLEKKEKSPSSEKILKIADYLDCSIDYLLGRTNIPENPNLPSKQEINKE